MREDREVELGSGVEMQTDKGEIEVGTRRSSRERQGPVSSAPQSDAGQEEDDVDLRSHAWEHRTGIRALIVRNKLLAGVVCALSVMSVGVIASWASREVSRPRALAPPSDWCSGGANGQLRRLSREAYQYWQSQHAPATDNLVIMLADGYGAPYHTMARAVRRLQTGNMSYMLPLDPFLIGGAITGASSNSITDSAAGATAYSTARKTFNGALGVVPKEDPAAADAVTKKLHQVCGESLGGTVRTSDCDMTAARGETCCPVTRVANTLEACRAKGMATGIVVTTVLPHATPAAWSAHASARGAYDFIAQQQLEADPPLDVMLGGGKKYFDSRRADGRDLLAEHADRYTLVQTAEQLRSEGRRLQQSKQVDRLNKRPFGSGAAQQAPEEEQQPSLAEMTDVAIRHLEATGKRWCLVVEGSRVDHGGHDNDAAASLGDALAYNDAFEAVLEHAHTQPRAAAVACAGGSLLYASASNGCSGGGTQVVSLADHSTGGLTLGAQLVWEPSYKQAGVCRPGDACKADLGVYPPYDWHPHVLAGARASQGHTAAQLCCNKALRAAASATRAAYISERMGVAPSAEDLAAIDAAAARLAPDFECRHDLTLFFPASVTRGDACFLPTRRQLSLLQQRAALVAFTTLGHTGDDIQVFAAGSKRALFQGMYENKETGRRIFEAAGIDPSVLESITQKLNECQVPVLPD